MSILEQLRKLAEALPVGAQIGLNISHRLNFDNAFEPMPPATTEVFIFTGKQRHSFYVSDDEWAQGTVVDEIVAVMQSRTLDWGVSSEVNCHEPI